MGYEKAGPWENDTDPAMSAANMNQMETQYDEADAEMDVKIAAIPDDGAVDVASLRTLGDGAVQAAAGNHTHDIAWTEVIIPFGDKCWNTNYELVKQEAVDADQDDVLMWAAVGMGTWIYIGYVRALYKGVQKFEATGRGVQSGYNIGGAHWHGDADGGGTARFEMKTQHPGAEVGVIVSCYSLKEG